MSGIKKGMILVEGDDCRLHPRNLGGKLVRVLLSIFVGLTFYLDSASFSHASSDDNGNNLSIIYAKSFNNGILNSATIKAAISSIGTDKRSLIVSPGTWSINEDVALPTNINLRLEKGVVLSINKGIKFTVDGSPEAPITQIFIGDGDVIFGKGQPVQVYPQWWGARGDGSVEDTQSVQKAIDSVGRGRGGDIIFIKGTYLVNSLVLDSNVNIIGEGSESILKQKSGAAYLCSVNPGKGGTPDIAENKHNISIRNIQFKGTVSEDRFAEHVHLLNINAVTGVTISNCKFSGWRGDGIYIGSSNTPKTERHNKNITIKNCVFDGINKDNRNAVTIIDGDNVTIENNSFANCTRPNMPGAIDMEPDANGFSIMRNIRIANNKFNNIGGMGANIALFVPVGQKYLKIPSGNIVIEDNAINGDGRSDGIVVKQLQDANETTEINGITVSNNRVTRTKRPFVCAGIKGVKIKDNIFEDSAYSAIVSEGGKYRCQNIEFEGNVFKELGGTDGVGVSIFGVDGISFIKNIFDNIGLIDGTYGVAIKFNKGTAERVRIEDNSFIGGRTVKAVQKESGSFVHTEGNGIRGNIFHGNMIDLR